MATRNVARIMDNYDNLVEDMDLVGIGSVLAVTGLGAAVSEYVQDMVAPHLNQTEDPTGTDYTGRAYSAGIKLLTALLLFYAGWKMGGDMAWVVSGLGAGAFAMASVETFQAVDTWWNNRNSTTTGSTRSNRPQRAQRPRQVRTVNRGNATAGSRSVKSSAGIGGNKTDGLMFK